MFYNIIAYHMDVDICLSITEDILELRENFVSIKEVNKKKHAINTVIFFITDVPEGELKI
jgi:hypothetical protein